MVEIHADQEHVTIDVQGLHKLWAFKRKIDIPRSAVRAVRRLPGDALAGWWKGWRVPGTHVPGVIVAGTFFRDGERHFWDVRHPERAIEIELDGQKYDRLFVEVPDPELVLRELQPS